MAKIGEHELPEKGADHPTHQSSAVPGPFSSPVRGRVAKLAGFHFASGTTVFARLEGLIRPDSLRLRLNIDLTAEFGDLSLQLGKNRGLQIVLGSVDRRFIFEPVKTGQDASRPKSD